MPDTGVKTEIEIAWVPDMQAAAAVLARAMTDSETIATPLVPSSLQTDDPAIASIRQGLRDRGIRTTVIAPRSAASLLARGRGSAWHLGTVAGRRVRIDARLARAPWIAIAVIDAGHYTGPFMLDISARFLHPADRVRLAARPERLRLLADIGAIAPPRFCLVLAPADGGWLTVATSDQIAAELWALGIAERHHAADIEMQGPWEDATVQRATELGLGIRIPSDMQIRCDIPGTATEARSLLHDVSERLGLPSDFCQTTGENEFTSQIAHS